MKENPNKHFMKVGITLFVILGFIVIAKSGFVFGQWLFAMLHY